jgi:hypothetical protein
VAALVGIGPKDEMEGMIAAQLTLATARGVAPSGSPLTMRLGTNFNNRQPVILSASDRRRPLAIFGQTGPGKSTVMKNMALQDIENGER